VLLVVILLGLKFPRNLIYAAFCLIVIGPGLFQNSFWVLIRFIPAAFAVFYIAIAKEEKYSEKKFRKEFIEYKNKVRCWL